MKIDRLIGILSILLQQEKVTAPYLADKFEVSRRTISRDIEDINRAGIPLVTMQGQNGGITIMDGYRVDRTLLTSSDMQAILAGLRSLDSVCGTNQYQQLMEKFCAGNSDVLTSNDHIMIDLSSWYKNSLAPKIALIQKAIGQSRLVEFDYYSPNGEGGRVMEPYFLSFQWSSWYVYGFCRCRGDYRMFKLNRMVHVRDMQETFEPRQVPKRPDLNWYSQELYRPDILVKARFQPGYKWRLIDEYGAESFTEQADGTLLFTFGFAEKEGLIGWLMTFQDQVELLEPAEYRSELAERAKRISQIYET